MHRDIKPENIVLENPNGVGILKLIDFGISTKCDLKKFAHPRCGTPGYIAPEIIELNNKKTKTYSNKCDIFSAGVILFKMYYQMLYSKKG
jgi:calcium-dependent protein kinase